MSGDRFHSRKFFATAPACASKSLLRQPLAGCASFSAVISGLFQIGIHSVRLNTKELGELYYNFNNPDTAVREPLGDFNKVAKLYVQKGSKTNKEES